MEEARLGIVGLRSDSERIHRCRCFLVLREDITASEEIDLLSAFTMLHVL